MARAKVGGQIRITPEELGQTIEDTLEMYSMEIVDAVNDAAKKTARDTAKTLRSTSPVRTDGYNRKYPPGSYAKSWGYTETSETLGQKTYTVKNAKHYQLTHLLEHGHIDSKTGKRVGIRPHIAAAEQAAITEFKQEVEKGV